MKTKNLFLGMMAGLLMVACTNDNDPVVENNSENAREYAFIQVKINDGGAFSRSTDGGFDAGSDAERKVNDATFYFFKANGDAFPIQGGNNFVVHTLEDVNHTAQQGNVSDLYSPIVVIDKVTGEIPTHMIAVINAPAGLKKTLNLSALKSEVGNYLMNGDSFIMSNSVYAKDGKQVDATYIPSNSIVTDKADLAGKAIDVYVERVAAKVTLKAGENNFLVGGESGIYAKVAGWELYNGTDNSKLIKAINPNWTTEEVTFTWNDAVNFRSYWASSETESFGGGHKNWNDLDNAVEGSAYYHEFTTSTPKLIVKVEFYNESGEKVQIFEWLGNRYTLEDLKTAMAGTAANTIYVGKLNESAKSVSKDYLNLVQRTAADPDDYENGEKNYDVIPELIELTDGTSYLLKDENGNFTEVTCAKATETLRGSASTAAIWGAGGYYMVEVDHFGMKGMVRNHSYEITVENIQGLGTPVYDPDQKIWEEDFESKEAYIAASINILSWKVISNNVTLE